MFCYGQRVEESHLCPQPHNCTLHEEVLNKLLTYTGYLNIWFETNKFALTYDKINYIKFAAKNDMSKFKYRCWQ